MLRQLRPALEGSYIAPLSPAMPARWLALAVAALLLLTATRATTADDTVEVICPDDALGDDTETEFCNCNIKRVGSSRMLQVKCDFKDTKAALLTARFYPMGSALFSSAYVRISNARGVRVTQDFMREWQKALSSALDIWHSGQVELSASPAIEKTASYKTFVGIGIIDCQVQGLPSMLIRDHHRGALRVKDSTVGVIEPGFIHNIDELRYLVLEDCAVSSIAGPITSQAALTLSHKELHTWNGLLLSNVTVDSIAPNAFNLTHRSDTEEVVMRGCHVGLLGTAGIKVTGDVALNITGNTFSSLQRYAIQVDSVKAVVFSGNTLLAWAEEALEGLQCPDRATVVDNSVVTSDDNTAPTLHFHPSCGVPNVRVVSAKAEMLSSSGSGGGGTTTAVVVVALLLLAAAGGGMVAGVWWWRSRKVWRAVRGDTPLCEDQDQPDMNNAVVNVCHMNKPDPVVMLTR